MVSVFRLPSSIKSDTSQPELELEDLDGSRVNPLGMGVLSDGTPFLTQRGLALICGVENAHIGTISSQWRDEIPKPRINKIRDILRRNGHNLEQAHVAIRVGGRVFYAYREEISLAVIEYYAFEAGQFSQEEAKDNYRILARKGFRDAIYESVNYRPAPAIDVAWQPFHDRISLAYDSAPDGYFSIFKESAEVTVTLGQGGIFSNQGIIPDISIGRCWSDHWRKEKLAAKFGERLEYEHNYPAYFPQAASNPQTPWCYPEGAMGEFRRWLREDYVRGGKLTQYIRSQVGKNAITGATANQALAAYKLPAISYNRTDA
ncbi:MULTISPECIES: hypothetical protein [unclassified Sphingobium]|uniref:hypothetical protein n=1 Tax=unclassified Sphingobium TaxID=2611147 RepID=UPI0022252AFD|nr:MULTISPECIES: hypothetical protein [unclassified Sphingobium]MCW2413001.1 hypothetical protein [Sphingobium sp. B8D3D]MCW2414700.1 hypothetical protein [Sphingobium sp. B8D3A]